MSDNQPVDTASIRKQLDEVLSGYIKRFGARPLSWLALFPVWTESLASRCNFPGGDLAAFLKATEAAALCRRGEAEDEERVAWLRARALAAMVGVVPRSRRDFLVKELLDETASLDSEARSEILTLLVEGFGGNSSAEQTARVRLLNIAHEDVAKTPDPVRRSLALCRLANAIPDPARSKLLHEALDVANAISDTSERVVTRSRLAEMMPTSTDFSTEQLLGDLQEETDWLAPFVSRLTDPNRAKRQSAASALARFGKLAAQPLIDALNNDDRMVRLVAGNALGRIGGSTAIQSLSKLIADADARMRAQSVAALGRLRTPETIAPLTRGLQDEDSSVRVRAATALGSIRDPRVVAPLRSAMQDPDAEVRYSAAVSLLQSEAGEALVPEALEVVRAEENLERRGEAIAHVARFLPAKLRDEVVWEALEAAAQTENERSRSEILVALAPSLEERRQDDLLRLALGIADTEIRLTTLASIAPHLGSRQTIRAIDAITASSEARTFWMPDTVRGEISNALGGQVDLRQEAVKIASAVLEASNKEHPVSTKQVRWARLAEQLHYGTSQAAGFLVQQVRDLIRKSRTGDAQESIAVGEILAASLHGELESAVLLGYRLLEMEYRRQQDERYLHNFLERREQVRAFERLLKSGDDLWALHYLGMGGVGKTMLVRHITAKLARQHDLATARIDFDYVSPDFPSRKPGQLLIELAAGLRAFEQIEDSYQALEKRALELHESLSQEPPREDPLANVRHADFSRLLVAFVDMLLHLKGRRTLLILDTCEELAKLHPAGGRLPSIEATFHILEAIHREVPSLRVIFAGRRPLARGGYDWKIDKASLSEADMLLPERKDYLLLHEVRGFDEAESTHYLTDVRGLSLSSEMKAAVLERSLDKTKTAYILRANTADIVHDTHPAQDQARRFNPFDLALYAEWLSEDPQLSPEVVVSGDVDPYVEMRIIHRIKHERVRQLMPAAVLLRRFTPEMIRAALDVDDETFKEAFDQLGAHEWMNVQRDEALQARFLEIDRGLLPRLTSYYEYSGRRAQFDEARARLGPAIGDIIRTRELREVGVDHLNAALKLLPLEEAGALWDDVVQRIGRECDWSWANNVTQWILGEDGAIGEAGHPLRSAVDAIRISAGLHLAPGAEYAADWERIQETARADPDKVRGRWLEQRAIAGRIAASVAANLPRHLKPQGSRWREWLSELEPLMEQVALPDRMTSTSTDFRSLQLTASMCAALDAVIGQVELEIADEPLDGFGATVGWLEQLQRAAIPQDLALFARILEDRIQIILGAAPPDSLADLDMEQLPVEPWLDWRPGDLLDRLRLERLRLAPARILYSEQECLDRWIREASERVSSIDTDRLVSCILGKRLATGVPQVELLRRIEFGATYEPERKPLCASHLMVPPLFVNLARGWLAVGEAEHALALLEDRRQAATRSASDPATVRAAEETKLAVIRRMRLGKREPNLIARFAQSDKSDDVALVLPVLAVTQSPTAVEQIHGNDAAVLHAAWSSGYASTTAAAKRLLDRHSGALAKIVKANWLDLMHLRLDTIEATRLAALHGLQYDADSDVSPMNVPDGARAPLDEMFCLHIRMATVSDREPKDDWSNSVGIRRMAEVALEEGELLALRLPEVAFKLLNLGREWFEQAGDDTGARIAAICGTMACLRAGNHDAARTHLRTTIGDEWASLEHLSRSLHGTSASIPARRGVVPCPSIHGRKSHECTGENVEAHQELGRRQRQAVSGGVLHVAGR